MVATNTRLTSLLAAITAAGSALAKPCQKTCPPFTKGTFFVNQYQLYPENADWDTGRCLVYFGALFNATVSVYDPYADKFLPSIEIPGIAHNPNLHVGGVAADPYTGLLTIVADAAAAFASGGNDVSGENWIVKYDPDANKLLWKLNITEVTKAKYSGFQDVETDSQGNTYVVGTFPSSILRVDKHGTEVKPWYVSPVGTLSNKTGFAGLAATGDILLTNDNSDGQIKRFDMTASTGTAVLFPHTPNTTISASDAIYLPPKYKGTVLLIAEDGAGISVLRSKDGKWTAAEYLGLVPNNSTQAAGFFVTAPLQIGDNLFMLEENFFDAPVPGSTSGNRTAFPLVDITAQVSAMVGY